MADPLDRGPNDPPRNGRLAADAPRKGAFPLIWLLVLAALLAFGWSMYNHYAGHASPAPTSPAPAPPATPATGSGTTPPPPPKPP